jgi:class 3 adenylate cyclase
LEARLAAVAQELDRTGWAAELCDAEWRLRWVSSEMRQILESQDAIDLGLGLHTVGARFTGPRWRSITHESAVGWMRQNIPHMAAATPGGLEALLRELPEDWLEEVGPLEPVAASLWSGEIVYAQPRLPLATTRYVTSSLDDDRGERYGWMTIYGGAIPASLLTLVARGSRRMFARMAELREPESHETAVLFADIQASSQLARHLSTAAFFELIRAFSTFADARVIHHGGIVGRHAGDGLSAFFLAEQVGSRAAACAAALRAARDIVGWRSEDFAPEDLHVNAGVHYGGALYLGQIVTGGRLEVSALGDEVNECARIQQSARNGALLASKAVVERLDAPEARDLGLDPVRITYRTVSELPGVDAKAVRDAGDVPVVALGPSPPVPAVTPEQKAAERTDEEHSGDDSRGTDHALHGLPGVIGGEAHAPGPADPTERVPDQERRP